MYDTCIYYINRIIEFKTVNIVGMKIHYLFPTYFIYTWREGIKTLKHYQAVSSGVVEG